MNGRKYYFSITKLVIPILLLFTGCAGFPDLKSPIIQRENLPIKEMKVHVVLDNTSKNLEEDKEAALGFVHDLSQEFSEEVGIKLVPSHISYMKLKGNGAKQQMYWFGLILACSKIPPSDIHIFFSNSFVLCFKPVGLAHKKERCIIVYKSLFSRHKVLKHELCHVLAPEMDHNIKVGSIMSFDPLFGGTRIDNDTRQSILKFKKRLLIADGEMAKN